MRSVESITIDVFTGMSPLTKRMDDDSGRYVFKDSRHSFIAFAIVEWCQYLMNAQPNAGYEYDSWRWFDFLLCQKHRLFHEVIEDIADRADVKNEEVYYFIKEHVSRCQDGKRLRSAFFHIETLHAGYAVNRKRIKSSKEKKRENCSRGGKKRSKEQQKKYEEHCEAWAAWEACHDKYKNLSGFYNAMEYETGSTAKTVRAHIREFKGVQDLGLVSPSRK